MTTTTPAFGEMYRVSIFPADCSAGTLCPGPCPGPLCGGGDGCPSGPGAPCNPSTRWRTAIAAAFVWANADIDGAVAVATASPTHSNRCNCPVRRKTVLIARPIIFGV